MKRKLGSRPRTARKGELADGGAALRRPASFRLQKSSFEPSGWRLSSCWRTDSAAALCHHPYPILAHRHTTSPASGGPCSRPGECLKTDQTHAAEALARSDDFGTIQEGKRADLILLEGNSLEDVSHIRKQIGVMVRGR